MKMRTHMDIYGADTVEYRTIDTDELYEEQDVVFWFYVPNEWADKWCKENGYDSLEEFDTEYVWSDSWEMYTSAKHDNVVISIKETEVDTVFGYYK